MNANPATTLPAVLSFDGTDIEITDRDGSPWVGVFQIGRALGYANSDAAVSKLYNSNKDEFTPDMTALVDLPTAGGVQKVRIFSPRGCHLIAMFARTAKAKAFRRWVLDVLDKAAVPAITHQPTPALPPPAEPPFCTGCAARGQWNLKGADRRFHPLATGPLTWAELKAASTLREALKDAAAEIVADNTRLRREAGQFAAIKAILMGETK